LGGNHNVGSARYQGSEFPFLVEKPIHELLSSKINKSTSMLRRFLLQVSVDRKKKFKEARKKEKKKRGQLVFFQDSRQQLGWRSDVIFLSLFTLFYGNLVRFLREEMVSLEAIRGLERRVGIPLQHQFVAGPSPGQYPHRQ